MKIITEKHGKNLQIETQELKQGQLSSIATKTAIQILDKLSERSYYPKELAKTLKLHEQNVYYYIKKLEKNKIIEVEKREKINGTTASFYKLTSPSYFFKLNTFKESTKINEKTSEYLYPFIENGNLNAKIVVGSPDPHGPQKARSKDGYFGMDLALFLGSFITYIPESKVLLDTEITDEEIKNNHLIILGGPIVNRVSAKFNSKMPIYFDEEKKGVFSKLSNKIYHSDEIGVINKIKNPENKEKQILSIMGLRNAGTRAAILSFLKYFSEVKKPNLYDNKTCSKVVEGIDLDSDGRVDEVEFLE